MISKNLIVYFFAVILFGELFGSLPFPLNFILSVLGIWFVLRLYGMLFEDK